MSRFGVRQLQSLNKNWGNPIRAQLCMACARSQNLLAICLRQSSRTCLHAQDVFLFKVGTPGWFELRTLKSAEIRYGDERERKAGIRSADLGGEYDKIALNEDRLE